MSRMYENKPLMNLPVNVTHWTGSFLKEHGNNISTKDTPGVLCDGKICNQARINVTSTDDSAAQARYFILFTKIERAHRRKYDEKGVEIEPNFSETTKVSKGYLNTYAVQAKGNTDCLSVAEVVDLVKNEQINNMIKPVVDQTIEKGDLALLMCETDRLKVDLPNGSLVRLKTCGNCPFIETLVIRDNLTATKGNFVGDEKMGDAWLEKIAAAKAAKQLDEEPSEIADDEWDD